MAIINDIFGWMMVLCGVTLGFGLVAAAYRWALRLFALASILVATTAVYVVLRTVTVDHLNAIPFAQDLHPLLFVSLLTVIAGVVAGSVAIPALMITDIDELRADIKELKTQVHKDNE